MAQQSGQFVVIFDIYTALLKHDSEGTVNTHYRAKESLQQMKETQKCRLIAAGNAEMKQQFQAATSSSKSDSELIAEHFGEGLFESVSESIEAAFNVLDSDLKDILVVSADLKELYEGRNNYRTAWFNHLDVPQDMRNTNMQGLDRYMPDFTIIMLQQLESILGYSMTIDREHFEKQDKMFRQFPPSRSQREVFGLLFDALDTKFVSKPIIHAMLTDHPDFYCMPIFLGDDLNAYKLYPMKVIIQKVTHHNNREKKGQEAFEADQTRLEKFCAKQGIKVVDGIREVIEITNRITFNRRMTEFLSQQPDDLKQTFRVPVSVEFDNSTAGRDLNTRLTAYETQAKEVGLEYPVLLKIQTGQKSTYAHTFYCVHSQNGMREALDFVGFANTKLLIQAYLPHKERVYKVYGIGPWFRAPVRRSVPDQLMRSKEAVQFDSQIKWTANQFTEYDETENLLNMPLMEKFFAKFADEFNMKFYGVDIIVDVRDGTHHIVDCNYLANYNNIPKEELIQALDDLMISYYGDEKIKERKAMEEQTQASQVLLASKQRQDSERQGFFSSKWTLLATAAVGVAVAATVIWGWRRSRAY